MSMTAERADTADVEPALAFIRSKLNALLDDASKAVTAMREAPEGSLDRYGQAERAIALHEAAHHVRDVLDRVADEQP